jgi:Uma2 family endonuclease
MAKDDGQIWTLADLVTRLAVADLDRVWFQPAPGTATPDDVQAWRRYYGRTFELVEQTLVERPRDPAERAVAEALGRRLDAFVRPADRGVVCWSSGCFRLPDGTVRVPSAAFLPWSAVPGGRLPGDPIPALVPALVAEVRGPAQSDAEFARRRADYRKAGIAVFWAIDPARPGDVLDGGAALPGFRVSVRELLG